MKNLGMKAAIVCATTAVSVTMFAAVALAAPVLPAGTTSGPHNSRGTCSNCHTFAAPVTPPVVTPPVVTPPVVTPPVVTPPVLPAGTTSGPHNSRGTCSNCHTFAAPVTPPVVTPPVVTPPVVTPPVVTPPVVTPPVVTPPVVTPPVKGDDDHDGDVKPAPVKKHHEVKRHKRSARAHD